MRHTPISPRIEKTRSIAVATIVFVAIAYSATRVNWVPIITPDSLDYLDHSNDLIGIGLIQLGYRQFGYPLFLAATDAIGQAAGIQPLALTVVLQHVLLVTAIATTLFVLRLWAIPTMLILLLPTMTAYPNLVLTEAIAIPIAVVGGVAVVAIHYERHRTWIRGWLIVATLAGVALPMIRLHYLVITVAIAASILVLSVKRHSIRRIGSAAVVLIVTTSVVLVGALSLENRIDNNILFPSLGSERQLFWITWVTVVEQNRADVASAASDVYLDGWEYSFIQAVDKSGMSFAEQRTAYTAAVDQIYDVTGASRTRERLKSFAGVISGSRIDDLRGTLANAARPDSANDPDRLIHQYGSAQPIDIGGVGERYNAGKAPTGALTVAARLPNVRSPYFGLLIAVLVPAATLTGIYLLCYRRARVLAGVGLTVVFGYASASYLFIMDNLRFLLPGYLFAIVVVSGALSQYWRYDRMPEPLL